MDSDTIKSTYLVQTHDGWHEFRATFAEAELETRACALSSYRHGGNGRAYLFAVPNGAGNQPAEVEFTAARQPINLPLGVASCCRLYVAAPYRGADATGSLGLVSPDIVRHHFAEIFAPSAQQPSAEWPGLISLACLPLCRAILSAINLRQYNVNLHADGSYHVDTSLAAPAIQYSAKPMERVWSRLAQEVARGIRETGSPEAYAAKEAAAVLCLYGERALDCFARSYDASKPESWEDTRNRIFSPYFRPVNPHA